MRSGAAIALVGCGRWGRNILRDLVDLGARTLVVDPDPAAQAEARAGGAAAVLATLDELPSVDGAVIATPTTVHAAAVSALLDRGLPVFCEKPLTADPASAAQLAARAPARLFVMDKWRYHPGVEALAAIARAGELGPVVGLRTRRLGASPHADVDAVWILAPHELSIGLEILAALPAPRTSVGRREHGRATALSARLGVAPWHELEIDAAAPRRREIMLFCRDGVAALPDPESPHLLVQRTGSPARYAPAVARLAAAPIVGGLPRPPRRWSAAAQQRRRRRRDRRNARTAARAGRTRYGHFAGGLAPLRAAARPTHAGVTRPRDEARQHRASPEWQRGDRERGLRERIERVRAIRDFDPVLETVAVAVGVEGIGPMHVDLGAVFEPVVVAVGIVRVRPEGSLRRVVEAIAVAVEERARGNRPQLATRHPAAGAEERQWTQG